MGRLRANGGHWQGDERLTSETTTLEVILDNKCGSLGVEGIRILLDQGFRKVVDVLGQAGVEELDDF